MGKGLLSLLACCFLIVSCHAIVDISLSLVVYGPEHVIYVNQAATFDYSATNCQGCVSDDIYYAIDYGDGSMVDFMLANDSTHSFSEAGTYTVTLYGSDIASEGFAAGLVSDSLPVPVLMTTVIVSETEDCYLFHLSSEPFAANIVPIRTPITVEPMADTRLYLRVVPQGLSLDTSNGKTFAEMGMIPTLTISSCSNAAFYDSLSFAAIEFDDNAEAWVVDVSVSARSGVMKVSVEPSLTQFTGCSTASTSFFFVVAQCLHHPANVSSTEVTDLGARMAAKGYNPIGYSIGVDPCNGVGMIAAPKYDASYVVEDYLGTVVMFSGDLFQNNVMIMELANSKELAIDAMEPLDTITDSSSICVGLSAGACKTLAIYDIEFVGSDTQLVIMTSRGLILAKWVEPAESFATTAGCGGATPFLSLVFYPQTSTGIDTLDRRLAVEATQGILWTSPVCLISSNVWELYVSVVFDTGLDVRVINTMEGNGLATIWNSVAVPSQLGLGQQRMSAAVFVFEISSWLFLSMDTVTSQLRILSMKVDIADGSYTSSVSDWTIVGDTLPESGAFDNLVLLSSGTDLLITGTEVWHATVPSLVFKKDFDVHSGARVVRVEVDRGGVEAALITSLNEIYYYGQSAGEYAKVPFRVTDEATPHLIFTEFAKRRTITQLIFNVADGNISTSAYPTGLFASPGVQKIPFATLVPLPVEMYINTQEYLVFDAHASLSLSEQLSLTSLCFLGFHASSLEEILVDALHLGSLGITSNCTFSEQLIGKYIHQAATNKTSCSSGLLEIAFLLKETRMLTRVIEPWCPVVPAASPSLRAKLTVYSDSAPPAVHSGVFLTLSLDEETTPLAQTGWLASDRMLTAQLPMGGSVFIDQIINASVAHGIIVSPWRSAEADVEAVSGVWRMYDFASTYDAGLFAMNQTLTVTAPSAGLQNVSVNVGHFDFETGHLGSIMSLRDGASMKGLGKIVEVYDEGLVSLRSMSSVAVPSGSYSAKDTSISVLKANSITTGPLLMRAWTVEPAPCCYSSFVSSARGADVVYIDRGETLLIESATNVPTVGVSFTLTRPDLITYSEEKPGEDSEIKTTCSAKNLVFSPTNPDYSNLYLAENDKAGRGTLVLYPTCHSVRCRQARASVPIVVGCDPSKAIKHNTGLSQGEFLYGDPVSEDDTKLVERIPVNYRPPSAFGRAIPTTSNVYNADPSQPLYMSTDSRSKGTAEFKQCAGAASREECRCTDDQRFSDSIDDSDCIDRVFRVFFGQALVPEFVVLERDEVVGSGDFSYTLVELNDREDYCINGIDTLDCTNITKTQESVIDPHDPEMGIVFSGAELYHFHVYAISTSYCSLEADFKVWVYEPGVQKSVTWTIISSTLGSFGIALFGLYLLHYRRHGARF